MSRSRTARARELRRRETQAERKLWQLLRGRTLCGWKFRRQAAIGRFVVDFFCHDRALVIEADGPIHERLAEYDAEREAWLTRAGFTVLRFANVEIGENPGLVQRTILQALAQHHLPLPPRGRGRTLARG